MAGILNNQIDHDTGSSHRREDACGNAGKVRKIVNRHAGLIVIE